MAFVERKLGSLEVSSVVPPQTVAGQQKPKKPKKPKVSTSVGRPAPLVALHERYGLVYDPKAELDPIVADERAALNELYRERAGRDLTDAEDLREALERVNLLQRAGARKRAKSMLELRRQSDRETVGDAYASALDALDAERPKPGEVGVRGFRAQKDTPPRPGSVTLGGAAKALGKDLLSGVDNAALIGYGIRKAGEVVGRERPERGEVGVRGFRAQTEEVMSPGDVLRRGVDVAGRTKLSGLAGIAPGLINPEDPTVAGTVGEIKRQQQSFATGKGMNQVPEARQLEIARSVIAGIADEETVARELAFIEMMASGMPASDGDYARGMLELGPLDPGRRKVYADWARQNGWDIADAQKYTDADLAKMAFATPGAVQEATRSYFRQLGEFAAAPLAIPAIIDVATSGDRARQREMIEAVVSPYVYLKNDIRRRGLGPALSSFAQERPLDFLLIANSLWRAAGRGAGAAARTYGGTGTSIFQVLVPPATGGFRRTVGEFARTNRPVTVPVPRVERAAGEVDLAPVAIAFTNRNLADTLVAEGYALALRAGMRAPLGLDTAARFLAGRRTQRAMRRANNVADDAAARATIDIREATRGLNSAQLLRMAMELTVARVRPDAGEYFFSQRAQFFRELGEDALRQADEKPAERRRLRADAKRFFDQADLYQRVNDTPLERSVIDQVREIAREVGGDNDTIVAMLMGAYDEIDNPSGLERSQVRYAELSVGDRIDIGSADNPVPAVVTGVERLPDGRLSVTRRNIIDPRDELSVTVLGAQRVDRLRPGVNAAKYTRQMIEWERLIDELAKEQQAAINIPRRAAAQEANRPLRRIEALDARRRRLGQTIERLLLEIAEAREGGRLARARSRQRLLEKTTRQLLVVLREMQRIADAEDLPATIRMPDGSVREVRLADELERQRREIITRRGIGGRAPVTPEGERIQELPDDVEFVRQTRLGRAIEGGETAPAALRQIIQPEARRLAEQAQRLDARAAELRRLEQDLIDARAAAPSAAQARRAEADLERVREEAASLERQSAGASQVPRGLDEVFDELKARLEFIGDRRVLSASLRTQRSFNDKTRSNRARAARELADIRRKVLRNGRFTPEDIDALERVESVILGAEKALGRYKAFDKRPGGVRDLPAGFGVRSVRGRVGGPESSPRGVLRAEAAARREREGVLAERVDARAAAPQAQGPVSIGSVRRERKRLEKEAQKNRREARRIIERGRPVADNGLVRAVVDATSDALAFEIQLQRPVLVKLDQMRELTRAQVIANAELYGLDPVLYLGTRVGRFGGRGRSRLQGEGFTRTDIDLSETGGIPGSRLQRLTGAQYRRGLEDVRNAWRNLMFDTGVIRGALEMQRQMRLLVESVGVRIDNVTDKEAALINGNSSVRVSEGESVVYDARDYVAIAGGRPVDQTVFTGVSRVKGDEGTLYDLFAKEVGERVVAEAGGDYILIPKYMYEAMVRELNRITYRPSDLTQKADLITKQWRNFTLNIFPRTGFANLVGSAALAAIGGAGPRSFYLAARYILYGDVPGPTELRQRFGMTLTTEADFARVRAGLPQGRARIPGTSRTVGAEDPLRGLAYWMNIMRRFNGISEDFGRLAVWYSRAFPEASRLADDTFRQRWINMRSLSNDAEELLEAFAGGDPRYTALAARFTDAAYEWVGDLHAGGSLNTKLRIAFPFQQWYRHMLRLTLITMPLKYPGRTLFLTRVSEIGQEYQREHGILPPWFADVMPFLVEEKLVGGIPQEYILGWRTSNLNPWATVAELFTGGDFDWADYGVSALNPIWTNSFSALFSALYGTAQEVGRNNEITNEVRNQYGFTIDTFSSEGYSYLFNLLFKTLPGNSMALSTTGQSAEGNVFWGETPKLPRGSEGFFMPDALSPDRPGKDFRQVITDFSYTNLFAFLARVMLGGSATWITGRGPVQDSQFKAQLRRAKAESDKKQKEDEAGYRQRFKDWARIQQENAGE